MGMKKLEYKSLLQSIDEYFPVVFPVSNDDLTTADINEALIATGTELIGADKNLPSKRIFFKSDDGILEFIGFTFKNRIPLMRGLRN